MVYAGKEMVFLSQIQYAAMCHRGKVRRINQDNLVVLRQYLPEDNDGTTNIISGEAPLENVSFFGVFDGMGGEEKGEAAAFLAASLGARWNWTDSTESMLSFCDEVNRRICRFAEEKELYSSGTTAAMLLVHGSAAIACNIGDSRIYRIREYQMIQLSVDHVVPMAGRRKAPLLQCLGIPESEMRIEPEIREECVQEGDLYLICSDGLTDMIDEENILKILMAIPEQDDAVQCLIQMALDAGGMDNISVILIGIQ